MRPGKANSNRRNALIASYRSIDLRRFIRANFSLGAVATVPEISLYTAGPRSGLWRLAERDDAFGAPYWAHLWGGGLALARYVLDNPELVSGRRVLDLGAGSGIVGIAAAKAGASAVVAADIDPYAITAIELNAETNAVTIATRLGDLSTGPLLDVDIVLVGDLFYDAALAAKITALLDRCLASGVLSLIGDPCRAYLPRSRLRLLAEYPGPDFSKLTLSEGRTNSVFLFDRDAPDQ